jgi:glycosyltransferase involved in cell wall biosynthesis
LHRALRAQAEVVTLSFSRQYPAWLFPGQSDRDPYHRGHREPHVDYCVDSLNPRTWANAVSRFVEAGVEAVILPWWTVFFAPLTLYLRRALTERGIAVVFLCHNVSDHEGAFYKRALSKLALAGARGYCVQSQSEQAELRALLPKAHVVVHPHPLYDHYPPPNQELPRRAKLELLFFGVIRPYKGLDLLLDAMALLKRQDVHLSIVGEFWQQEKQTRNRIDALGLANKVEVVGRYVDEQEAANYFERADLVVLPYRSASGTGIIPMAYHYDKPVLATRVGGLIDAVREGDTGYLVEPRSPRALADAIDAMQVPLLTQTKPAIQRFKATLSWSSLGRTLCELAER